MCLSGVNRIIPNLNKEKKYEVRLYNRKPRGQAYKVFIRLQPWNDKWKCPGYGTDWSYNGKHFNKFQDRELYQAVVRLFEPDIDRPVKPMKLWIKVKEV